MSETAEDGAERKRDGAVEQPVTSHHITANIVDLTNNHNNNNNNRNVIYTLLRMQVPN